MKKSSPSHKGDKDKLSGKIEKKAQIIAEKEVRELQNKQNSTTQPRINSNSQPSLPHETNHVHDDTNEIMWNIFWSNFESFAEGWLWELRTIISNHIEEKSLNLFHYNKSLEVIMEKYDLWKNVEMKKVLLQLTDPQKIYHGDNHCECLLKRTEEEKDKHLFKYLQSNIMWLFDPCFIKRIWIADLTKDATFFSELSKEISSYIKEGPRHRGGYHHMRAALVELNRIGMVDLESGADLDDLDEDWNLALEIMRMICKDVEGFRNSPYLLNPKKFKKAFSKSFSKLPCNTVRYSHPMGGEKITFRWLSKIVLDSKRNK